MFDTDRAESEMLTELGYTPGWFRDIQEGDYIAWKSYQFKDKENEVTFSTNRIGFVLVTRLEFQTHPDRDMHGDLVGTNTLAYFIGEEDGVPRHFCLNVVHSVWIKR